MYFGLRFIEVRVRRSIGDLRLGVVFWVHLRVGEGFPLGPRVPDLIPNMWGTSL